MASVELIITSPFGICPRELEETFPIQSYDVAVTGNWSQDEIDESGKILKEYVKGKTVVAHVSGGSILVLMENQHLQIQFIILEWN